MTTYRIVELNLSGVVDRIHELRFADDAAACAHAAALGSAKPVEVWCGTRRVALVPPRPGR